MGSFFCVIKMQIYIYQLILYSMYTLRFTNNSLKITKSSTGLITTVIEGDCDIFNDVDTLSFLQDGRILFSVEQEDITAIELDEVAITDVATKTIHQIHQEIINSNLLT